MYTVLYVDVAYNIYSCFAVPSVVMINRPCSTTHQLSPFSAIPRDLFYYGISTHASCDENCDGSHEREYRSRT